MGLMSGTSADGVGLALVVPERGKPRVRAHATYPYSGLLRKRLLAAAGAPAPELCRLNFELGRVFADAALRFLRNIPVSSSGISAVGSHGHTVLHLPSAPCPSTWQIGEPSFLAERLGVPVVSDFRPRDMAAGGQGAPIIPFLDACLFGEGPPRALQNIGGIANVSLVGRGLRTLGFDTGPGNCLIDLAASRLSRGGLTYDRGGRLARAGRIDARKAESLLRIPYFRRSPPKSLDRSAFSEKFLDLYFSRELRRRPSDAVATLTYFTALAVADAHRRFLFPAAVPEEVVVSGGGALNPVLMGHLRSLLTPIRVRSIADFHIPPMAKEPAAVAWMALLALRGRVNHCHEATGASGPRILGKITPASSSAFRIPAFGKARSRRTAT